jgi:DNA-binding XRE family transcriptional regulator
VTKSSKTENTLKRVGEKLKQLRIDAGYTSYENFAWDYDLSSRYYWGVEKGRNISLTYLIKILEIHKISIEDFFIELNKQSH